MNLFQRIYKRKLKRGKFINQSTVLCSVEMVMITEEGSQNDEVKDQETERMERTPKRVTYWIYTGHLV